MQTAKIEACVEAICNKGCRSVRADIRTLESGYPLAETEAFSDEERLLVLAELKSVMAAYGDTCRIY